MIKRFIPALLVCAAIVTAWTPARADIVVQYPTAPSDPNATLAATIENGVTATDLSTGGGLQSNTFSTWNWQDWGVTGSSGPYETYPTFADAVANGKFWTWGFQVATGTTISDLTLDTRLDRSGTGPNQVEIQASVNAGPAVSVLTFDYGTSGSGVDFIGVDLSALGTLNGGDNVSFTLAAFGEDSGGASSSGSFDLETVDFNGSDPRALRVEGTISVIPEPSSLLALAAFGAAGAVRRRRRR